jgi:hypothetical protein
MRRKNSTKFARSLSPHIDRRVLAPPPASAALNKMLSLHDRDPIVYRHYGTVHLVPATIVGNMNAKAMDYRTDRLGTPTILPTQLMRLAYIFSLRPHTTDSYGHSDYQSLLPPILKRAALGEMRVLEAERQMGEEFERANRSMGAPHAYCFGACGICCVSMLISSFL